MPGTPANFGLAAFSAQWAVVSWRPPFGLGSSTVAKYRVAVAAGSSAVGSAVPVELSNTTTSMNVSALSPNFLYDVFVAAYITPTGITPPGTCAARASRVAVIELLCRLELLAKRFNCNWIKIQCMDVCSELGEHRERCIREQR